MTSLFNRLIPSLVRSAAKLSPQATTESQRRLQYVCSLSPEDALCNLETQERGLTSDEANRRRERYGRNLIVPNTGGLWRDLLDRIRNPLVVQLLVICGISLWMGDLRSAIVVGAMLALSVGIAFMQERKSSKAVERLRAMVQTTTLVRRDGRDVELPMDELVPGDVVILDAGTLIPADLRIFKSRDLFVGQSVLTGESLPVEKVHGAVTAEAKSLVELPNACFQGSNVISGSAAGLVVNTGEATYFGAISASLASAQPETSFDRGIKGFTWLMVRFMAVMVCAVFLIVGFTKGSWLNAIMFALAVAVGLTPEMLPMIVTVNLSKGALSLSRKKVIVKKLNSIQNLGAIDILCTDKTGTLTQDHVILEKHVDVTGRTSEETLRYAYLSSYYQTGLRNLLDRAILSHAELDVDRSCRKVDELPFDFNRRRMSVVIEYEGDHVLICKGAVEEVAAVCGQYQIDDEVYPMIDIIRADLMDEYESLSNEGYRVLAIAYRDFKRDKQVFSLADEKDMVLLGYVAFYDPPKDSAAQALSLLRAQGVQTKILTGDHPLVTRKVCRDVGLDAGTIITGDQLQGCGKAELEELAENTRVFARLSPLQKEEIIAALRRRGHVVGYLGDGINDAPSLKAADVGLSVDTAADVAKEAADIVLLEKSLLVLEDGIIEGRRVFSNIIKYIRMGASSNFGNMFSVVGASYFLPFLPMAPIQILLNNLLYDVSQLGIPTDRVDEELTVRPRQWSIANIRRFMIWVGPISSLFDYATFVLMLFFFGCWAYVRPETSASDKAYFEQLFHTGWFVESLFTQTLIVHIIRTRHVPLFQSRPSGILCLATLVVMAVGGWLPYSPFARFLGLVPLPRVFWAWLAAFLLGYAVLAHVVKVVFHRRYGDD